MEDKRARRAGKGAISRKGNPYRKSDSTAIYTNIITVIGIHTCVRIQKLVQYEVDKTGKWGTNYLLAYACRYEVQLGGCPRQRVAILRVAAVQHAERAPVLHSLLLIDVND
mmetsp:Transcript_8831/g.23933  ORF Transcript_8831/g.23933 Transcript_8831/m.23933 type:complete len:111 (-) Transcript_8831:830-1162(-)